MSFVGIIFVKNFGNNTNTYSTILPKIEQNKLAKPVREIKYRGWWKCK